jgi:large conductance mechanosensitive channel
MKFMSEFRQFALKRNALDLAIGVVLGAAFQRVVDALVNEVLMPPLTWLSGNVDTGSWTVKLGPVPIGIGSLINAVLQFGLISFSVFIQVQALNRIHRRHAEHVSSEPISDSAVELLREIRDLLKKEPKS